MNLDPINPARPFRHAAGTGLIAVAINLGQTPAERKSNLATLYEAGAISGETFSWALAHYQLEAA